MNRRNLLKRFVGGIAVIAGAKVLTGTEALASKPKSRVKGTLNEAIKEAKAGDIIYLAPGHTEFFVTSTAISSWPIGTLKVDAKKNQYRWVRMGGSS